MKKTIQIPQGNEFSLFVPFVVLSKNGRTDASAALWNNVQVVVHMSNKSEDIPHTTALQEQYVVISFDNSLKLGSYDVIISGDYEGRKVSAPLNNLFSVTNWADGNYAEFVVGQPIECPTQTIIGQFNTTQDIIDLTEELRAALAAAEAAKEEYEEKVAELDNVAQQGTNPDATNTAILTAIGNISIDTTTIAKQGNNPNTDLSQVASDVTDLGTALNQAAVILAKQGNNVEATLSDTQTAAQNAAAAVKDGNDTAVGVAKEIRGEVGTGSDTAAETGTLFAVIKWVKDKVKAIFNLIGSPASGQPATLFAAIAAGGGGGGDDTAVQLFADKFRAAGVSVPQNATLYDLYNAANQYTTLIKANTTPYNSSLTALGDVVTNRGFVSISCSSAVMPNNIAAFDKLQYFYCSGAITLYGSNMRIPDLKEYRAKYTTFSGDNHFYGASNVYLVDIQYSSQPLARAFNGCTKLIDLNYGSILDQSLSISNTNYNPTQAYRTDVSTLCFATDQEEYGQTFSTNFDKWKWCIINHFAANLPDRTGLTAYTITFGSTVLNKFDSDMTTAFTSKNWTLA